MHVALIYTEVDVWALGMRTVSSVLKQAGYSTRIITMGSESGAFTAEALAGLRRIVADADAIGISCFSRGSEKAHQIVRALAMTGKPLVWGGVHATLNPEDCLKSADLVCVGEGEGFMIEFLSCLESGRDVRELANLVFKEDGVVRKNPLRPLIEDLDGLPLADYSFADEFRLVGERFEKVSDLSNVNEPIMFSGSRGCARHCTYCTNAKMKEIYAGKGRYLRKMSIPRYIEQARLLRGRFPNSRYYYFIDEDFLARSLDDLREFAREFWGQVGLPFECMVSPTQVTEEKIDLMVRAGMWRVRMGVESGSERTKTEVYRRAISNASVSRAAAIISRRQELVPYYFFIMSNPYEAREDVVDTLRFISGLPGPFYIQAFNLVFFPGSVLYERAVADRFILGKDDSGYLLDFRGGLKYEGARWKRKNLYLNGLLFLMEGKKTARRAGLIPLGTLRFLLKDGFVEFMEKYQFLIVAMIEMKIFFLRIRKVAAQFLTRIVGDPRAIFGRARIPAEMQAGQGA